MVDATILRTIMVQEFKAVLGGCPLWEPFILQGSDFCISLLTLRSKEARRCIASLPGKTWHP
jgi:hypothetical protein